jgi:hypothetical protein
MDGTYIAIGGFTLALLVGCASSKPSPAQVEREARLAERLENASPACAAALKRADRLERMKEKAKPKTAGDVAAGMVDNYWAAIPIPGAKLLAASQKDRDELGMYNSEGCWKLSCVEEKLAVARADVETHCEGGEAETVAPQPSTAGESSAK